MTRYLCVHPGHERKGKLRPVDLSPQVRMERAFAPHSSAYLASTEETIRRVRDLPRGTGGDERLDAVKEILTGTPWPLDAPALLVSETRVRRAPGLYELDELRTTEGSIDDLFRRTVEGGRRGDGSDDLVVLDDADTDDRPPTLSPGTSGAAAQPVVTSPPVARGARVIPQGTFPIDGLARRLAQAPSDEDAIVEAIRATPSFVEIRSNGVRSAWRVVVPCPVETGVPAEAHRVVFTGTGGHEPGVVFGTPAEGTWDELVEDAAHEDLVPPAAVSRQERRLRGALLAEIAIVAIGLLAGWLSGALGMAIRETPGWFGVGVALAAAAIALAAFGLFSPHEAEGNENDILALRSFYASRIDLLWWSSIVSVGVFALALLTAVAPPIVSGSAGVPAPAVTFGSQGKITTANVRLNASGIATDEVLIMEARQFGSGDPAGTLVGRWSATGDAEGHVRVNETMALDAGAQYLSIQVVHLGDTPPACTPAEIGGPGCTVLSVPPLGAGVDTQPIVVIVPPSVSPSPAASSALAPSPSVSLGTVTASASP